MDERSERAWVALGYTKTLIESILWHAEQATKSLEGISQYHMEVIISHCKTMIDKIDEA